MDPTDTAIKLIKAIENEKVLYDYTLVNYDDKTAIREAWKRIEKEMDEPAYACKTKWRNIKDAYARSFKRHVSPRGKVRRGYYLSDRLKFLKPFMNPKETKQARKSMPKRSIQSNSLECQQEQLTLKCEIDESGIHTNHSHLGASVSSSNEETHKRIDGLDNYTIEYIPSKTKPQVEDADFLFLKSILPDMYDMTTSQKHKFKSRIMSIIGDILYSSP